MSTVDEIKAAALQMSAADKLDLYRRLNDSDEVRQWQREELKKEIQKGIDALERGDFTEHDPAVLETLGHEAGTADGTYGPATTAAVVAFQKAQGLTEDGIAGPTTLTAINAELAAG